MTTPNSLNTRYAYNQWAAALARHFTAPLGQFLLLFGGISTIVLAIMALVYAHVPLADESSRAPAMPDDPLVFVEVAFTDELPTAIAPLLEQDREPINPNDADTVVFYSISNCHPGLAGVSFGNFLIKQVVEEVRQQHPNIKAFVTLSPVSGFRKWLERANLRELIEPTLVEKIKEPVNTVVPAEIRDALMRLCAHYLLNEKSGNLARDPVARFHLGNGARLHRLHWAADLAPKGKQQSAGIMVNYLYDLNKIEINHEAYFDQGEIAVSKTISKLL